MLCGRYQHYSHFTGEKIDAYMSIKMTVLPHPQSILLKRLKRKLIIKLKKKIIMKSQTLGKLRAMKIFVSNI